MASRDLVDWNLAAATGRRLVPPGPPVGYAEAEAAVEELRGLAAAADGHVRAFTGLDAPAADDVANVVDRPGWIGANVAGFRSLLEPLTEALLERRPALAADGLLGAVGSRVTGAELGALLAYLATRVLGQYEVFLPPGEGAGRLTLVAPNVVAAERALGVDPHDFRLWVCLHEATHRLQFTAVPWLREHVRAEVTAFLLASDLDPAALARRLRDAVAGALAALRGSGGAPSLVELVQTPEQRVILDRLTGLMSLVEGHGEFVMDGVGPTVVPSVETIRAAFERRRRDAGTLERTFRRLIGLETKMRQYAEGERFVHEVVDAVGMDGFNRVWTSPNTLPSAAEVRDPAAWVARVHGHGAAGA